MTFSANLEEFHDYTIIITYYDPYVGKPTLNAISRMPSRVIKSRTVRRIFWEDPDQINTGMRASNFQDDKDVDVLRSPVTNKKCSNLIV